MARKKHKIFQHPALLILLTLLLIALLGCLWSFQIEPVLLKSTFYSIKVPNWPEEKNHFRIAVLSDNHTGPGAFARKRLEWTVEKINRLQPHLILLLGDYMRGSEPHESASPEVIAQIFGRLSAPLGVYAVPGNHDYWHNWDRVSTALEQHNIKLLVNEIVPMEGFTLIGLDDFTEKGFPVLEFAATLRSDKPAIIMSHNPDVFGLAELPEGCLMLSGHTHGGQVNLPFIGPPIVPSMFGQRYAYGHIREKNRQLVVSGGSGNSILQVRLNRLPEILLLELSGE